MFRLRLPLSALAVALTLAAPAAGLAAGPATGPGSKATILTSYPDEVMRRFEAAFEQAHPGVDAQFVWMHGRDAGAWLRGAGRGVADVYWTPSPATFAGLAADGLLAPLAVDRVALPGRIGGQDISDPAGRFEAFEVAGYGVAWSPAAFARLGLPAPTGWAALTDARLNGALALPVPAQVGFAPALYDVILQAEGWEGGWALLLRAAANAELIGTGGQVTQAVLNGKAAAPTIDFFAAAAIADGHPLALAYPSRTAFLPAHVAVLATAPAPGAAQAFADFVLSEAGQKLLFAPDVHRHPVRPAVYAAAPAGTANPFANGDAGFVYDAALGRARAEVIAALFDRAVTRRHDRLKALWAAVNAASGAAALEAGRLAGLVPLAATEVEGVAAAFRARRDDPAAETRAAAIERAWDARLDDWEQQALAVASGGETAAGGTRP